MIFLVDAGNTRIKWATWSGGEVRRDGVCATHDAADFARACKQGGITHAVAACVAAGDVRLSLARDMERGGIAVHWLQPEYAAHGLVNRYQPPESLGADRYAALVGAARSFHRDCVVVGVGTAMTVDMLTSEGEFLGGCIVPGPDLMRASLLSGTAGVGASSGGWREFPRETGTAVDSGIALALRGVVQGMRGRLVGMGEAKSALPAVILTGGARACLRPLLPGEVIEIDELVLEGLAWIARDMGCAG